ncbi:MAG TPA: LLM class flavin-dependent oxidoreductase [Kribbellaceae bacterium]
MTDYGHDVLFGTFLTPRAADPDGVVALARLTEDAGLDLVTVQDHPYQPRFLDAWTLLSVIAARTRRVRVAPNVANLPLRPPAVLARSAASLDLLSGGRVELGLGAGAFWEAIAANGGPHRSPGESVEALAEAIEVIRALWTTEGGGARTDGTHYRLSGAKRGPAPAHDIGIWIGAARPQMLRLIGRLGDGWLVSSAYAGPELLDAMERGDRRGRRPRRPLTGRDPPALQPVRVVRCRRQRLPARAGAGVGRAAPRAHRPARHQRLHPRLGRAGRHPPVRRRGGAGPGVGPRLTAGRRTGARGRSPDGGWGTTRRRRAAA